MPPSSSSRKPFGRKIRLIAEARSETAAFAADDSSLLARTAPAPGDANPIDRAIFERLALVWAEEAGRWTEDMQGSLVHNLSRARVTRSTAAFTSHWIPRTIQQSGEVPTWGQFVVMRVMYGPAACFRKAWAAELARRYPLALEDAYDGVVPDMMQTVRDVLDGKVGMPVASRRKISIMELRKDRKRTRTRTHTRKSVKRRPAAKVAAAAFKSEAIVGREEDEEDEEEGNGEGETVDMMAGRQPEEEEEAVEVVPEEAWNEAAASAASMDPNTVIAKLRRRYREQTAQIQRLRKDNEDIRKSLDSFNSMAAKVKD